MCLIVGENIGEEVLYIVFSDEISGELLNE